MMEGKIRETPFFKVQSGKITVCLVIFRPYNNDDLTDFLVGQRSNVFKLDSIKQTIQVFEDNKV